MNPTPRARWAAAPSQRAPRLRSAAAGAWVVALVLYYRGILFTAEAWTDRDLPDVGFLVVLVIGTAALIRVSVGEVLQAARGFGVAGWLALVGWGVITLAWSPNTPYGATKLATLVCFGILPGALVVVSRRAASVAWWPVLAGGVLFSALVWASGEYVDDRLTVAGGNPIWIARACLTAAAVAIWAPNGNRALRLIALASCGYVAVATGSRGPLVAFAAAPLVYAALRFASRGPAGLPVRRLMLLGGVAAAAVAIAVALDLEIEQGPLARVLTLAAPPRSLSEDAAVAERIALQRVALQNFSEHPFGGVGAGGNAPLGTVAYPHNIALEIASEFGLVGLAAFASIVVVTAARIRSDRMVAILFWQTLLYAFASGDLGSNELLVIFACAGASVPRHAPGEGGRA